VSNYNARKHRSACDVTLAIAERFLATVYYVKIAGPAKFKVDDSVRVSKYKIFFENGYTSN